MWTSILSILAALVGVVVFAIYRYFSTHDAEAERLRKEGEKASKDQKTDRDTVKRVNEGIRKQLEKLPKYRPMTPTRITLHHSLTPDGKVATARNIDRFHREKRRWFRIGYHCVVQPTGAYEDATNSVCRPLDMEGAGVKGENKGNIHVCIVGTKAFTRRQITSAIKWIDKVRATYNIPIDMVKGHYQYDDAGGLRTCPGFKTEDFIKVYCGESKTSMDKYYLA